MNEIILGLICVLVVTGMFRLVKSDNFILVDYARANCYKTRPEMVWMYATSPRGTCLYEINLPEVRSGETERAENILLDLEQKVPDHWTPFERRKHKLDIAELRLSIADGKAAAAKSH